MNKTRGLSIYVVVGPWATPMIWFFKNGFIFRLCLGFIAFAISKHDIECVMGNAQETLNKIWGIE